MDVLYTGLSWGSPVGLSLFFFFSGIGAGVFFWGISHLSVIDKKNKEEES